MATVGASATARCHCSARGSVRVARTFFRAEANPPRFLALRSAVRACGAGQDVVGSWIDLASFVSSAGSSGGHTPYDELADKIGRDVYIDVVGWHLYLKDVKLGQGLSLAQALAAQLGPKLQGQHSFREADLAELLSKVPIKLGGGKVTTALADVVPSSCMRDFERACEDYARSC